MNSTTMIMVQTNRNMMKTNLVIRNQLMNSRTRRYKDSFREKYKNYKTSITITGTNLLRRIWTYLQNNKIKLKTNIRINFINVKISRLIFNRIMDKNDRNCID